MTRSIGFLSVILSGMFISCTPISPAKPSGITLTSEGKTDYVIVTASDAIPSEKTAAMELQTYLKEISGADFPIIDEKKADNQHLAKRIDVGWTENAKQTLKDVNRKDLKADGIVIRTEGDSLYLAGGRPRGTLYAVYTFLEDVLGVRWWTPTENYIPKSSIVSISSLNMHYTPRFMLRSMNSAEFTAKPLFAAHCKMNGYSMPANYGGSVRYAKGYSCHTYNRILKPSKYFGEHPEWYPLINGKRCGDAKPGYGQLCLSNKEAQAAMAEEVMEIFKKDPAAKLIHISQGDSGGFCECEKCKELEKSEGSLSGPVIYFANGVAEIIEKELPDVKVVTFAYQGTRKPPFQVKPRKNVIVQLCSIECSFTRPFSDPSDKYNAAFMNDLATWNKISPHLFIWDYIVNFSNYILPHPNTYVLAPNIRTFADNGVEGILEQTMENAPPSGDFGELKAWLASHLLWNPNADDRALVREFLNGYYGAAAPELEEYLDLIDKAVKKSGIHLSIYMSSTSSWMTLDDMNKATELFAKAMAKVKDNPVLVKRVQRAQLPLSQAWLIDYFSYKTAAKQQDKAFLGPTDPIKAAEDFISACSSYKTTRISEGSSFESYAESLRAKFNADTGTLPDQFKNIEGRIVEIQENMFSFRKEAVEKIDDPNASNGNSLRLFSFIGEQGTVFLKGASLGIAEITGKKVHAYAVIRADVSKETPANALICSFGIWRTQEHKSTNRVNISSGKLLDAKWHVIDLGECSIGSSDSVWMMPSAIMPDQVKGVFLDRMIFVVE